MNSPAASAALLEEDTTTQGTWIGTYGSQGQIVVGTVALSPSYASVTEAGGSTTIWAASTADSRGLENSSGTSRVAEAWSSPTSFTVNVNLTDGATHVLSLYAVDWDNQGRSEQIQISNAATGAVLATQTISNFSNGIYLDWSLSGNVQITFTRLAGPSAVLSGFFLDAPPTVVTLVTANTATKGNWVGTFGTQGYDIPGLPVNLPSYATITSSVRVVVWDYDSIDPEAFEQPGSDRPARHGMDQAPECRSERELDR